MLPLSWINIMNVAIFFETYTHSNHH
jgi:hypothetical protein